MNAINAVKVLGQKIIFKTRKIGPQICTIAGVAGFVTAAVMIVKDTRKAEPIFKKHEEEIKNVKEKKDKGEIDGKKAGELYFKVYRDSARDLAKTYWREGLIIAASTGLVISTTHSLAKNLSSTTAALAALDGKFKKAEERTTEKYGKEVADEIFYGIKKEMTTSKQIDPETGEETEVTEENFVYDKDEYPLFTLRFDKRSDEYEKNNHVYNINWIRDAERIFANNAKAGLFVLYNDIVDYFGYDKVRDEYHMDWGYGPGDTIKWDVIRCGEDYLIKLVGMHPLREDLKKAYGYKKIKISGLDEVGTDPVHDQYDFPNGVPDKERLV